MSDSTFAAVERVAVASPPAELLRAPAAAADHATHEPSTPSPRSVVAPVPATAAASSSPRRSIALEFFRYFAASGGALGVDIGLYQLSLHAGLAYPGAALVGFCAGAVVAYLASVLWVFEARTVRSVGIEFALFVGVGAAGLLLTEALLWLQIAQWGMPAFPAKVGASGVVFVFNFAVRKAMLFSARAR